MRTRDGRLHELDVLVLATGFRVDRFLRPIRVIGRDGLELDAVWEKRPSAYLSISIPGFPNLFMLNGPNGPVGNFSLIEVAELQLGYVLQLVEQLRTRRAAARSAPSEPATARFEARAHARPRATPSGAAAAAAGTSTTAAIPASWPWTFDRFRAEMSAPKLEAYEQRR